MSQSDTADETVPMRSGSGMRAGQVIADSYRLERTLGAGGMGEVWAARALEDDQLVAVKIMLVSDEQAARAARRFVREARAVGAIDSPHVTRLIDSGTLSDGRPFLVLELLDGEGLDELARRRAPLPIVEAVDLVLQACEGVAEAHTRGIVHRDLKPSNLYCTTDAEGGDAEGGTVVKVLDFGIAKPTLTADLQSEEGSLTESNALLGSPQYMSPEQIRAARNVDGRADIWALGIILYKLLTAELPFEAATVGEYFAVVLSGAPVPLRRRRPEAPAALERAIDRCLAKSPSGRHRDIAVLATALGPFAAEGSAARVSYIADIVERGRTSLPSFDAAPTLADAPTVEAGTLDLPTAREPASSPAAGAALEAPAGAAAQRDPMAASPRRSVLQVAFVAAVVVALGWLLLRARSGPMAAATSGAEVRAVGGAAPAPAPTAVTLTLRVQTPGARLELDGVAVSAAAPIMLPYGEAEHRLVASAPGYATSEHSFAADRDRYLEIALERTAAAPSASGGAGRGYRGPQRRVAAPHAPGSAAASAGSDVPPPAASVASPPPPTTVHVDGPIEEHL